MILKNKGRIIMKRKRRETRFEKFLEMPKEIISNEPKITVVGFNEMLIENYKNILEYEEYYIKLNTYIGSINISGLNLNLEKISTDDIMVIGKIDSIEFDNIVEE